MKLLSKLGLVSKAYYDRERLKSDGLLREPVAERAKFRKAATDLAAMSDELAIFRAKRDRDNAGRSARRANAKINGKDVKAARQ